MDAGRPAHLPVLGPVLRRRLLAGGGEQLRRAEETVKHGIYVVHGSRFFLMTNVYPPPRINRRA